MHLSVSNTSESLIIIKMADIEKNSSFIIELQSTSVSGVKKYYSKSWGGLSGGAIAGIVIACVIALAVVSIAAITLKTSSTKSDGITHYKLTKYDNSFQE